MIIIYCIFLNLSVMLFTETRASLTERVAVLLFDSHVDRRTKIEVRTYTSFGKSPCGGVSVHCLRHGTISFRALHCLPLS